MQTDFGELGCKIANWVQLTGKGSVEHLTEHSDQLFDSTKARCLLTSWMNMNISTNTL